MTETHHYGSEAGTTYKWYDGDDRLVEVQQPHDPRTFASGNAYDLFSFAWSTRYLYDLSQNGHDVAPFNWPALTVSRVSLKFA